ncbi:hypothetical protein KR054_010521, partial [Drosophila jambulina]
YLRGCVCNEKPCLRICCRLKDWDDSNDKCTDGLMEELDEINPFLKVTLRNGSVVERSLLKDFIVLRDRLRYLDSWGEHKYTLFESFVVAFHDDIYFEKQTIQPLPGEKERKNSNSNTSSPLRFPFQPSVTWLSEVFLILTIAVYLYVRKLRNLHGKCFICHMIATFMISIHVLLLRITGFHLCAQRGYSENYFLIAKFSWLLAISHQLWRGFNSVNRTESEYSFGAYSAFAWGTPAILTGIHLLIDQIWDKDPNKVKWVPGSGWGGCYFKIGWTYFYYIVLPVTILVALNTALFILTIVSIIKVKLSLRHVFEKDDRTRNRKSKMQSYKAFSRLIILVDIPWSLRLICYFGEWDILLKIFRYCDACVGIIIFFMFVLKRSTLKYIMEK